MRTNDDLVEHHTANNTDICTNTYIYYISIGKKNLRTDSNLARIAKERNRKSEKKYTQYPEEMDASKNKE